jgi:hypothetical protein
MEDKIMAEKKVTQTENKEIKPIILKDETNGDVFVLEFDRASVKFAEARGFRVNSLDEGLNMSTIEELFFCAFRKHQPNKSKADTDKILYDKLKGMPEGMLERLVELFLLPFNTLVQTEETAKNSTMTVEF